ncbi:hypothetical protein M3Y96_00553100 [Aphelenchoides besseyi]|nr:hypothetical protein M3Y96_00553100 [Aphelenchoides besseyi]
MDVQEGESETNQKKEGAEPTKKADETSDRSKKIQYEFTTAEEINNVQINDTTVDIVMSVETILGVHVTKDFEKVFGSTLMAGLSVDKVYAFRDLKAEKKTFSRGNTVCDVKFTKNSSYELMGNKIQETFEFVQLADVAIHVGKFQTLAFIQKELKEQSGQYVGAIVYGEIRVPVKSNENFSGKKGQKVKVKGRYSDPFVVMDMWTVLQDEALELNNPQLRAFKTPTRKRKCA